MSCQKKTVQAPGGHLPLAQFNQSMPCIEAISIITLLVVGLCARIQKVLFGGLAIYRYRVKAGLVE
jgi:hypothetical protein